MTVSQLSHHICAVNLALTPLAIVLKPLLQKHYIGPRVADATLQYTKMSFAIADIVAAGGSRSDDALLISFLPLSFHTIRTILRTRAHTIFYDFYNELLVHTYAEECVHQQSTAGVHAVSAPYPSRGFAKGKGAFGPLPPLGRGAGRNPNCPPPSASPANPCFKCGRPNHLRPTVALPPIVCSIARPTISLLSAPLARVAPAVTLLRTSLLLTTSCLSSLSCCCPPSCSSSSRLRRHSAPISRIPLRQALCRVHA